MTTGCTLVYALLCAAAAFSAYAKDRLLVTTNWASGIEQVLLIDPETGLRPPYMSISAT